MSKTLLDEVTCKVVCRGGCFNFWWFFPFKVKSGVMEPFVLEQNFLEYTNSILHPKKYFSHLYQGSVPEFDTNFQAQTHKLVQGNQGVQRTAKSSLGYRYGLSIGQLIERINTKVEVSELDIALEDCEIKATAPEIEIPPITDIKTLLTVETDIITEVKCVEEEADSTMSVEVTMKKERRWALGTQNPCQVCGDKAAGFYCGAFVCEACKVCKPLENFCKCILGGKFDRFWKFWYLGQSGFGILFIIVNVARCPLPP